MDLTGKNNLSKRYSVSEIIEERGKQETSERHKVMVGSGGPGFPSKCILLSERSKTQKAIYCLIHLYDCFGKAQN